MMMIIIIIIMIIIIIVVLVVVVVVVVVGNALFKSRGLTSKAQGFNQLDTLRVKLNEIKLNQHWEKNVEKTAGIRYQKYTLILCLVLTAFVLRYLSLCFKLFIKAPESRDEFVKTILGRFFTRIGNLLPLLPPISWCVKCLSERYNHALGSVLITIERVYVLSLTHQVAFCALWICC